METLNSKKFALVTGASQGLGRCYALALAKRNINTILVALPNENLSIVAEECRAFGVASYYFETDITDKNNVMNLTRWVNQNFNVSILINNAGCGGTKSFTDCDVSFIDRIIQLNVAATSIITHQLMPNLLDKERSYILNVSSMASFSPIGYKTVYAASKCFIKYFSKGLSQELKNTNVIVSVVHPGPMKTNQDVTRRIEKQGIFGKIGLMSPERVAEISIRQLFRREKSILLGLANKLNWLMMNIIPEWLVLQILTKAMAREVRG